MVKIDKNRQRSLLEYMYRREKKNQAQVFIFPKTANIKVFNR